MSCTTEELYRSFAGKLKSFVTSKTNDPELAKDLVHETFLKVARYCEGGGSCRHPRSLLYRITLNAIADHFRSADVKASQRSIGISPESDDEEALSCPEGGTAGEEDLLACVSPLIDHLPSPYREAVRLADIEGIPQQQIAARMGITLSGAKSRVQRGRERLRALLLEVCQIEHDRYGNILECEPRR